MDTTTARTSRRRASDRWCSPLLWCAVVFGAAFFGSATPVLAQEGAGEAAAPGLPASQTRRLNLDLSFRQWRRSMQAGAPKPKHLRGLWAAARSYGYRNAVPYALAATDVVRQTSADGTTSAGEASRNFERIEALAPDLPYPAAQQVAYILERHPSDVAALVDTSLAAASRAWTWPSSRFALLAFLVVGLLVAAALGLAIALFGQIVRHLGVAAHDLARRLPAPVTRPQVVAAIWIATVTLLVATGSALLAALFLSVVVSTTQHAHERVVPLAFAGLVAISPFADAQLAGLAAFSGSETENWLRAQYVRCDANCRADLESRLNDGSSELATYTLALAEVRSGEPELIDRAAQRLADAEFESPTIADYATHLRGTALLATGRPEKAVEFLKRAARRIPEAPAPWFNLMRASEMQGEPDRAATFRRKASKRDVALVERMDSADRRDAPSHLALPPLPTDVFVDTHWARVDTARRDVLSPIWRRAAGPIIPFPWALPLGILTAVVVLATAALRRTGRASTPCPRCGLAREPTDPNRTGGHDHCLPCYRTFVGGSELGYKRRVRHETALGRHASVRSALRRWCSLLAPGSAHSAAGYPLSGLAISIPLILGIYLMVRPDWLWTPPYALGETAWFRTTWIGVVLAVLPAAVALWRAWTDLEPWTPRTSSQKGGDA